VDFVSDWAEAGTEIKSPAAAASATAVRRRRIGAYWVFIISPFRLSAGLALKKLFKYRMMPLLPHVRHEV
jgi:hypothetical protein